VRSSAAFDSSYTRFVAREFVSGPCRVRCSAAKARDLPHALAIHDGEPA
jgi:hypothetical protein